MQHAEFLSSSNSLCNLMSKVSDKEDITPWEMSRAFDEGHSENHP